VRVCLAGLILACAVPAAGAGLSPIEPGLDYHSFASAEQFRTTHINLDLRVDLEDKVISGVVVLELERLDPRATQLVLDTKDLMINDVRQKATDVLGATARIGFQAHVDRTVNGLGSHVNAIPFLLGTKYYIGSDREGLFGAFELGMFDLMSSVDRRVGGQINSVTSNDLKFGLGAGLGYQQDRWNARVNLHSQDVGNFGSAFVISGGIGYQFASL